jgi:hypothetical protein
MEEERSQLPQYGRAFLDLLSKDIRNGTNYCDLSPQQRGDVQLIRLAGLPRQAYLAEDGSTMTRSSGLMIPEEIMLEYLYETLGSKSEQKKFVPRARKLVSRNCVVCVCCCLLH